VKLTSCLVPPEAVKKRDSTRRYAALRVEEFGVATSGGIWVAIREIGYIASLTATSQSLTH